MTDNDRLAVEALCNLTMRDGDNNPFALHTWKGDERTTAARAVLAAIRKGEVPGVYCSTRDFHDLWRAAEKDLESLRAKLAAYESDAAAAAGELRVSVKDCGPGTLAGTLLSANVILRHSKSDLLGRAVDAEAERDQLRAEVEREKARADRAEARMSVIDAANRSPDPCAWERLKDAAVRATSERDQMRAEVEREKERADKAEAALAVSRQHEAMCHCGVLLSEHTQSENHGAVQMDPPCPDAERADKATAERDRLAESLTRIADRCAAEDSHDMSREERRLVMRAILEDALTAMGKCTTCRGTGKIDQRLGGLVQYGVAPCPDCSGRPDVLVEIGGGK